MRFREVLVTIVLSALGSALITIERILPENPNSTPAINFLRFFAPLGYVCALFALSMIMILYEKHQWTRQQGNKNHLVAKPPPSVGGFHH